MTLIRVAAEKARGPLRAILEVLNETSYFEIDGGTELQDIDIQLEESREKDGRTFWLWRLVQEAPRCILNRGNQYLIESETGAVRPSDKSERWVVREGVAVQRGNGSIDVAVNDSLRGPNRLVDETMASPTGAFSSTVIRD